MEKHVIQLSTLPLIASDLEEAHAALDMARFWKENVDIVVEWGTVSEHLRDSLPELSEYIFNTRLPITLLGCPKITENEIYSRVCKLYFETL